MTESIRSNASDRRSALHRSTLVGLIAVAVAVVVTLLRRWEPTAETWIYWFWSRVLSETGGFVVLDRAPLYTLYLDAFRWLPFPADYVAEYIVSTAVVGVALFSFGRRFLGPAAAVVGAVAWIPFLQIAEPSPQKLALSASLLAILIRTRSTARHSLVLSYVALAGAYLFRSTWLLVILSFAAHDVIRAIRGGGLRRLAGAARPNPASDWPLLLPTAIVALFLLLQSPHPWNNVYGATTTWFPSPSKSFTDIPLQTFHIAYALERYGSVDDLDWYFINRELFRGADSMFEAIMANPSFVARQTASNMIAGLHAAASQTLPDRLIYWLPGGLVLETVLLLALAYGALKGGRSPDLIPFIVSSILMVAITVFVGAKTRYMVPLVPLLLLSAAFWGGQGRRLLDRLPSLSARVRWPLAVTIAALITVYVVLLVLRTTAGRFLPVGATTAALLIALGVLVVFVFIRPETGRRAGPLLTPLAVAMLSMGVPDWESVMVDVSTQVRSGELRVLESGGSSAARAEPELRSGLAGCDGVMAVEVFFIGSFLDIPIAKLHDIWEIPPFGRLGSSEYDGLRPSRVECVVVSSAMENDVGGGETNGRIRYVNYIRPYVDRIIAEGGTTVVIPRFGRVVTAR